MPFIETARRRGDRINTAEITSMWTETTGGSNVTVAKLRDGTTVQLSAFLDTDRVTQASWPVLPAQPGFELLTAYRSTEDNLCFSSIPIIGWRVGPHEPEPITPDDYVGAYGWAVKYPDGGVMEPCEGRYENEAEWRTAMETNYRQERSTRKVAT